MTMGQITKQITSITLTQNDYDQLTPMDGVLYMIDNGDGVEKIINGTEKVVSNEKVILTTYAELKNLRDHAQLVPGQSYRITDYITSTVTPNTQSANHQFDIIVTAIDESHLSEEAKAAHHAGDTYFNNCNLDGWRIQYRLDNDKSVAEWAKSKSINVDNKIYYRYTGDDLSAVHPYCWKSPDNNYRWTNTIAPIIGTLAYKNKYQGAAEENIIAVYEEGKGVIYHMIDEYNNDCNYDFKNIKFKFTNPITSSINSNYYYYTFTKLKNTTTIEDGTVVTKYFRDNTIKKLIADSNTPELPFNVFLGDSGFKRICISYNCNNNILLVRGQDITLNNRCRLNVLKNCENCTLGSESVQNVIGNNSSLSFNFIIDDEAVRNTINYIFHTRIGKKFYDNIINNIMYSTIGDENSSNTFYNIARSFIMSGIISNTFSSNTELDNCIIENNFSNNTIKISIWECVFKIGFSGNVLQGEEIEEDYYVSGCYNSTFEAYLQGKTITILETDSYPERDLHYGVTSNGTLVKWNPADLVPTT